MLIQLPLETWMDILDWLRRRDLANMVDRLWDRQLTPIVQHWLHEWHRGISVGTLEINTHLDLYNQPAKWRLLKVIPAEPSWNSHREVLPIPVANMPDNIVHFDLIKICYLDSTFLAVLRKMRRLFHNIHLGITSLPEYHDSLRQVLSHLLPLINGSIKSIAASSHDVIENLHANFPSTFFSTKLLCIPGDKFDEHYCPMLAEWLFTPLADGQPRVLIHYFGSADELRQFLAAIRKHFLDSARLNAASAFFIVRASYNFGGDNEVLDVGCWKMCWNNSSTWSAVSTAGEQLRLRPVKHRRGNTFLVTNCAAIDVQPAGWLAAKEQEVIATEISDIKERTLELFATEIAPSAAVNAYQAIGN